ncbi:M17 family peptidase N-terminal domain-containing protein [[Flexibacter] sp. ATCC 35208]|uniref:M17 family peptidase N-terminal domain-containing protein n=1 Tax=[Flexibacter] sp. ATCC 35208 TaxID=1936242 RepID=UPI0009FB6484|nr:M17 family peptidase N-terminal domain-containing protein [[Flexibacter] sp. ATCC 35208]
MKRTIVLTTLLLAHIFVHAQQTTTAVGTTKAWGKVDGVTIEGLVQGPSATVADLQIACVFEYTEGDIFNAPPALPAALNGMVHLDEATNGLITEIRKSGQFAGHALETILITPPAGKIKAKKLLLIGLGDRNQFAPGLMTKVGSVAMREALSLNVASLSFASDLKDAGIDSPTALVAENVTKGMLQAYKVAEYLKDKHYATFKPLSKVILLAGPSFFTVAGQGIETAIQSFQ